MLILFPLLLINVKTGMKGFEHVSNLLQIGFCKILLNYFPFSLLLVCPALPRLDRHFDFV